MSVQGTLLGVTPQKNMRLVTSNLAPSAGYMGKKTLKRNRASTVSKFVKASQR